MTFTPGDVLAQYRITAKLGEGGMGEVYRATDTKLDREVAIKVLPDGFTEDPERLARFEREAKLLAQLQHPNIASIYGLEDSNGVRALVMELVEGPTLADRLEQGALSLEECLSIALQIAEALEEAHEKGIIHRDLKPQNVKASIDGKVKVLDFGLAKAMDPPGTGSVAEVAASPTLMNSPTLTAAQGTELGMILGTAAYMAPEQARGGMVDKRADIWAFGVVIYEMLTGRRLFDSPTAPETLARVLTYTPDLGDLPESTPRALSRLLRRCLARSPKNRLHDIADARIVLEEILASPEDPDAPRGEAVTGRRRRVAVTALLAGLGGFLLGLVVTSLTPDGSPEPATRERLFAELLPPPGTRLYVAATDPGPPTLSPDGRRVLFTALGDDGARRLWIRTLGEPTASPLPGTSYAQYPFWSPDGRSVGFFGSGSLQVMSTSSGNPRVVAPAINGKGGAWGPDGTILFSAEADLPIRRVHVHGGEVSEVTRIDTARHNSHRHPRFLPDGRRFLFLARSVSGNLHTVMLGSLDGEEPRPIATSVAQAELVAGHLLLVEQGRLVARRVDAETLELADEATVIVDDLRLISAAALAIFSASASGSLVYQTGTAAVKLTIEHRDRHGGLRAVVGEPGDYVSLTLSPAGSTLGLAVTTPSGVQDVWLFDLERNLRSRFTAGPSDDTSPLFSPDGGSIVYSSNRFGDASFDLYRQSLGGTDEAALILGRDGAQFPSSWSGDGKIAFTERTASGFDIFVLHLDDGRVEPLVATSANEFLGQFSPDARWFAFVSDESGRPEVYVTSVADPGRKWQVSEGSGLVVWWRRDGGEIMYQQANGTLVVRPASVTGNAIRFGAAETLFRARPPQFSSFVACAPSSDFESVYTIAYDSQDDQPIQLLRGWPTILEKL